MTRPALPDPRFARFNQTAAGIDFAYLADGQGPPVLLLHGWPLTSWSWRKILAPLADAGFTVIAPDLPGLGESGPAPEGYEKRTLVEPLRALLRALGHNRINLVGHDMGAPIAYAWARLYPHEVERLAILDVPLNGFGLDAFAKRLHLWHFDFFAVPHLPEALIAGRERALIEHFYPAYAPGAITAADIDEYARTYSNPDVTAAGLAYYRAMGADEAWRRGEAHTQKLAMPVLVLSGEYAGNYSPYESMAQLATDVRAAIIAGCGHYLAAEKPAETAAHLIKFLEEAWRAAVLIPGTRRSGNASFGGGAPGGRRGSGRVAGRERRFGASHVLPRKTARRSTGSRFAGSLCRRRLYPVAVGIVAAEPIPTQTYDGLELSFGSADGATTPGVR